MRKSVSTRKKFTSNRSSTFYACKQSLSARQMRAIVHLAVDADSAGAGLRSKSCNNRFRLLDLGRGRREHLVDHRHLSGVDGKTSGKPVAACGFSVAPQTFRISEVEIDGLDRRHFCGRCRIEAHRTSKTIGLGQFAPLVAVGLGTQFRREIFRSPR